ncbi:MAG: Gfo/Idh/MocA family oxidoreductase, partial [Actinomycetota bacterium]
MKVAVIGCGLIGRKRALALPPGAELVALADIDTGRAEALASLVPGPVAVTSSAEEAAAGAD